MPCISINLGDEDNSTALTQAHPPHILIKQPNHSKKESNLKIFILQIFAELPFFKGQIVYKYLK